MISKTYPTEENLYTNKHFIFDCFYEKNLFKKIFFYNTHTQSHIKHLHLHLHTYVYIICRDTYVHTYGKCKYQ